MAETDEIVVALDKEPSVTLPADTTQTTDKDPIADLQAQYADAQKEREREAERATAAERREVAERQRREAAERETQSARSEVVETRAGSIEAGLSAAQTESAAAKAEYKTAMEAGDWAKAADAQERLAGAQARIVRLDEAKADLEAAKTAPRREQPTQVEDPVEAYLQKLTPKSANWLRQHKDYVTDTRKNAKLTGAHYSAVGEGLDVDSPEYFAHVEKALGMTESDGKAKTVNGNGAKRPASAPVAPVQASAGGTSGGVEVRLSKTEAQVAVDGTHIWNYDDPSGQKRFKKGDPIGVQECARRKKAMMYQGLYDKTYVEQ